MFKKIFNFFSAFASRLQEQPRKGTVVCSVCGRRVKLRAAETYVSKEPQSIATVLTQPPKFYTVIDCPHCGNQIKLSEYFPRCPDDKPEEEEEEEKAE